MTSDAPSAKAPILPRRAFGAALLSAVVAGGAVGLAYFGGLSRPDVQDFKFTRSTTFATGEEARLRGFISQALVDDRIDLVIIGHTGDVGDVAANQALSDARAQIAQGMAQDLGIPASRINAVGVGGSAPLPKQDGESARAHQARLARVTVALQQRR